MMDSTKYRAAAFVVILVLVVSASFTRGADEPTGPRSMITLSLPENVELKALIDYVGKRKEINFLYDEQVAGKRVTIKTPAQIPADSLVTLLASALRMKGLTLNDTEIEGVIRIERTQPLTKVSLGPGADDPAPEEERPMLAMTRVFELEHSGGRPVAPIVKPFLSSATADVTELPEHGLVIVTDYASNMKRVEGLISVIDRPRREAEVRFVTLENTTARDVAETLKKLLSARSKVGAGGAAAAQPIPTVVAQERVNQVAIVGEADEVEEALTLLRSLDVSLGLTRRIYTLETASAEDLDRLAENLLGKDDSDRLYESVVDYEANLLIATTTPEIHEQIESLRGRLDQPIPESRNPIRFYKLENAKAADVMVTLRNIEGDTELGDVYLRELPGASEDDESPESVIRGPTEEAVNASTQAGGPAPAQDGVALGGARVIPDVATNSIIVVAKPSAQAIYRKLIEQLDVRRPQVLIEATVVTVDTTDGFELGVEIRSAEEIDGSQLLNFTQFGLTATDEDTGMLTLLPGVGYTGALLDSDVADAVIHALETDSRVKVVSRPSLLVDDNAKGELASENEEPFESVNAGNTVATTSFGGYSAAGTKITVKPTISKGEYLKLEFEIVLSSFGEDGSDRLPPSRQTNRLMSEATTIPDGHTIIVGGLTREDLNDTTDRVPLLGQVPGLKYLFSHIDNQARRKTMYVFLRAIILRDDKFERLKALSEEPAAQAGIEGDFPISEPVEIR